MLMFRSALFLIATALGFSSQANRCHQLFLTNANSADKIKMQSERPFADRTRGVVQITGKDIIFGQKDFPHRTPADPVTYQDPKTGQVYVYGTQVDGTGFSYLEYKNMNDLLRGVKPNIVAKNVFLPTGKLLKGQEAIWDTVRLPYEILKQAFSEQVINEAYLKNGIDPMSDLFYGGIALQPNGELGRWTVDNWRRRLHPIVQSQGELKVIQDPVFNRILPHQEQSKLSFGGLPFLPGDYIGHAYGPNFKLVRNKATGKVELWMINEEVTRRANDNGKQVEVTEIVARRMLNPFEASSERRTLVSVDDANGLPHPDSNRGPEMGNTKLLEGFRPTHSEESGVKVTKREIIRDGKIILIEDQALAVDDYFIMTGSQSNYAGDVYDALIAYRKHSAIGRYSIITDTDGYTWKKFLMNVKQKYNLSWAGRASFIQHEGHWWLLFHGVDKDIRPDGSYGGVIPADTATYHRNIYAVPIDFFQKLNGTLDMLVLD